MTEIRGRKSEVSKCTALRALLFALGFSAALLFGVSFPAKAQQAKKIPRIGILFIGGRNQPHLESFRQGLRERGYVEGKNIVLEYRYAEGKEDRLPVLAAELVRLNADIIVATADVSAS